MTEGLLFERSQVGVEKLPKPKAKRPRRVLKRPLEAGLFKWGAARKAGGADARRNSPRRQWVLRGAPLPPLAVSEAPRRLGVDLDT